MTNNEGSVGPGWYHAEGDPQGTQRYWNGSEWQGEPQAVPSAPMTPDPTPPAPAPPSSVPPPGAVPPPGGAGPGAGVPSPPPGGFGGQPSFGAPPAAAPKKSNTWKVLLGLFLVLVLGIGGCTFAVWRFASGPIDASNDFLNAIQQEDFAGAWALSNPSCFPDGGPQQLESIFGPNPVESYDLNSTSVTNNTGEASGRVTLAGGDERSISLSLTQVSDDWLVCGFDIGPPGS